MKADYLLEVFLGQIIILLTMTLTRGAEMQTEEYAKARPDEKKKEQYHIQQIPVWRAGGRQPKSVPILPNKIKSDICPTNVLTSSKNRLNPLEGNE